MYCILFLYIEECVPYSEQRCKMAAAALKGFRFVSSGKTYATKGCYAYTSGEFANKVYYGLGGDNKARAKVVALPKFRPRGHDCTKTGKLCIIQQNSTFQKDIIYVKS